MKTVLGLETEWGTTWDDPVFPGLLLLLIFPLDALWSWDVPQPVPSQQVCGAQGEPGPPMPMGPFPAAVAGGTCVQAGPLTEMCGVGMADVLQCWVGAPKVNGPQGSCSTLSMEYQGEHSVGTWPWDLLSIAWAVPGTSPWPLWPCPCTDALPCRDWRATAQGCTSRWYKGRQMQLCIGWGCLRGCGCVTGAGVLEPASLRLPVLAHEMSRGFLQGPRAWGCPTRHPSLGLCQAVGLGGCSAGLRCCRRCSAAQWCHSQTRGHSR